MLKPAMKGMATGQREGWGGSWGVPGYNLRFKNDLNGRDWVYGSYLDEDSLTRCVAYREGGKWVSLPFSGYHGNIATDMDMWGDTLIISGGFADVVLDNKTNTLGDASILMYYQDSIWSGDTNIMGPYDISTKGDSMIVMGGSYYNPPQQVIYRQFMTPDRGNTWQYPFSIRHPTDTSQFPEFNSPPRLEILKNGDILITNDYSPSNTSYNGVLRWDGQQWNTYGNTVNAFTNSKVFDFELFKDELYIGGSFANYFTYYGDTIGLNLYNPGNSIARWDGNDWQQVGGGITEGGVLDIMVHDSILYCHVNGGSYKHHKFGDALIPYFAGWDGHQWCGTPIPYDNNAIKPMSYGFINDTLFMVFPESSATSPVSINGQPVSYMMYFDGDYLHGPDAICSTPGLGEDEVAFTNEEVKVYPNPVKDELHVSLPEDISAATYKLLALDGKLVKEGKLKAGKNTLVFNERLNGAFLLKLFGVSGEIVRKVVFEN